MLLLWLIPIASVLTLITWSIGLYQALIVSPPDYQQGDSVRIMYIHVPAAYIALLAYSAMAIFSAVFLIWKLPLVQLCAESIAPIGAVFTFVCLATGSLWGKPIWGTWWVWDARLTSGLILLFLYLGYIALLNAFPDRASGKKSAAIFALIGALNLPIIKFSVEWWNTLHQPASLLRMEGTALAPEMLAPLLWMLAAYSTLFVTLCALKVDTALRRL
ncbi:MAG: heme ABC transporter permease [Alphaproteobacteria bacterium]|nr:heme ABC transporter permease [Alphaproteobacteria bacterium]